MWNFLSWYTFNPRIQNMNNYESHSLLSNNSHQINFFFIFALQLVIHTLNSEGLIVDKSRIGKNKEGIST